jgi:phosphoglycolate phosphatase
LKREGLLHFLDVIVGGEDVSKHKPDPESLNLAIRKLVLPQEELIYVGDSVTDAKMAKRSGVSFIAVLSGVTPRDAFDAYLRARPVLNLVRYIYSEKCSRWTLTET